MKNTEEQQLIQNLNEQIEALHDIVNTYKEYIQLQDKQIQGLESCLAITTDLNFLKWSI